jgi:hypothetical protein
LQAIRIAARSKPVAVSVRPNFSRQDRQGRKEKEELVLSFSNPG